MILDIPDQKKIVSKLAALIKASHPKRKVEMSDLGDDLIEAMQEVLPPIWKGNQGKTSTDMV